ncbi:hypothetical protein ACWC9T_26755 [Kitasatospora sp. NPDC001159]
MELFADRGRRWLVAVVARPEGGGVPATLRAVFLVNLPLSLAVLALAPLLVEDRAPRRPGLDPPGRWMTVRRAAESSSATSSGAASSGATGSASDHREPTHAR